MAHLVESMMYVGNPPWHGLGKAVTGSPTSKEALGFAGLDWSVQLAPVATQPAEVQGQVIPNCRAVVRSTDARPLGIVGTRYRPVQNETAFEFFDPLVRSGEASYETAGALDDGKKVWILAKLTTHMLVVGDEVSQFVLLSNSHDGSGCVRLFFTPVRVVCMNTLNLALTSRPQEGVFIRHTASAEARLKAAHRALGLAKTYYSQFGQTADRLVTTPFADSQMSEMAAHVLPAVGSVPSQRLRDARSKIVELFSEGRGHAPIRGTAWAALNAVAEYADHHRRAKAAGGVPLADHRLKSIWFGSAAAMKQRAYELVQARVAA